MAAKYFHLLSLALAVAEEDLVTEVRLGAMFPIYKEAAAEFAYDSGGNSRFAGFRQALQEINASATLLPNTVLKYSFMDSKRSAGA
ncbi:unnamed protein product, partial [Chrysoparadoxa australica]